jgi:hypothetical protein
MMKLAKHLVLTLLSAAIVFTGIGCQQSPPLLQPSRELQPMKPRVTAISFATCQAGKTPDGFQSDHTGLGDPASWIIRADPAGGKRTLAQTSADAVNKQRFPVCVYEPLAARNVEASVRFKPLSGKVDQSGGVIVRYQDKDNYYVLRANILEDNVRFYKLEKGKRTLVAGIPAKIAPGQWHTLKLLADGPRFICTFDNQQFEAGDTTFAGAGKIGLWTKADSVTCFDDLKILNYDAP